MHLLSLRTKCEPSGEVGKGGGRLEVRAEVPGAALVANRASRVDARAHLEALTPGREVVVPLLARVRPAERPALPVAGVVLVATVVPDAVAGAVAALDGRVGVLLDAA